MSEPTIPQKPPFEETELYLTLVKQHNEGVETYLAHWEKWSVLAKTDDERAKDIIAKEYTLDRMQLNLSRYIAFARAFYEDVYSNA